VKQVTSAGFSSDVTSQERLHGLLVGFSGALGQQGKAKMNQPFQAWTAGNGQQRWLSMLIDTMEQVSRPELRAKPCDGVTLAGLRAQLSLPASARFASSFSSRN